MVSKLYKKEQLCNEQIEPDPVDSGPLDKRLVSTVRLNILLFLSRICCCLKPKKEEQFFLEGIHRFREEIDIVEFFKKSVQIREFLKRIT